MNTEEEANEKFCLVLPSPRPRPQFCCASKCMAYWKWADAEHTKGYCAIAGKPEN